MLTDLLAVWAPLEQSPLFWLATTLLAYGFGRVVQRACRGSPLANPVLIAILLMAALLELTATPYLIYFARVQYINFPLVQRPWHSRFHWRAI